jgi:hypothetical protein
MSLLWGGGLVAAELSGAGVEEEYEGRIVTTSRGFTSSSGLSLSATPPQIHPQMATAAMTAPPIIRLSFCRTTNHPKSCRNLRP